MQPVDQRHVDVIAGLIGALQNHGFHIHTHVTLLVYADAVIPVATDESVAADLFAAAADQCVKMQEVYPEELNTDLLVICRNIKWDDDVLREMCAAVAACKAVLQEDVDPELQALVSISLYEPLQFVCCSDGVTASQLVRLLRAAADTVRRRDPRTRIEALVEIKTKH